MTDIDRIFRIYPHAILPLSPLLFDKSVRIEFHGRELYLASRLAKVVAQINQHIIQINNYLLRALTC